MSHQRKVTIIKYIVIILLALLIIIPFWTMIINSFKSAAEARIPNMKLPEQWQILENYRTVFQRGQLQRGFLNSLFITILSSILILVISTTAAYVFGRRRTKYIRVIFFIFLLGIIVPPSPLIVAIFLKYMNLLGTYAGMVFFYGGILVSLPIFLLSGFISTIPRELEESAVIDGASTLRIFVHIILPLLKPAIATCFIWIVLRVWNDFIYPLYILAGKTGKYTMVLSLYVYNSKYAAQWNLIFANMVFISLPVLIAFLFAQRQIVEGLTAGAIKG